MADYQDRQIISKEQAAERGLKRYFTGKPCRKGHIEERNMKGRCYGCMRNASNKYHWRHRDEILLVLSEYGKTSQKVKERRKKYHKENKEKRNLQKKEWYEKNKDKAIQYRKDRKDIYAAHARNRRAKYQEKHTIEDIEFLLKAQSFKCIYCKKSVKKKYHVDHIVPIALGGSNKRENLQILCPPCNLSKNKKHPIEFAQERGLLL